MTVRGFVPAARGLGNLVAAELVALGIAAREQPGGAAFEGPLEHAWLAAMWSRCGSRVLLELARVDARDRSALHRAVAALPWEAHLDPRGRFAVDVTAAPTVSPAWQDLRFAALVVKDGVVDRLRARAGVRPDVDRDDPDVRVHAHLDRDEAVISVELAGALHRRGYRGPLAEGPGAPLRETVAAAVLARARWAGFVDGTEGAAGDGEPAGLGFVDPMAGSGTLVLEALLIAGDVAPGLLRPNPVAARWLGFDAAAWARIEASAEARRDLGAARIAALGGVVARDKDPRAIAAARRAAAALGLEGRIVFEVGDVAGAMPPAHARRGLVATNPPYGHRLGADDELAATYDGLGRALKANFLGWTAAVLRDDAAADLRLGLAPVRSHPLPNGNLACTLDIFVIDDVRRRVGAVEQRARAEREVEDVVGRIRKRERLLRKWREREGVTCWRVYDADVPQFKAAVDRYGPLVVVHDYAPPPEVPPELAQARLDALVDRLPELLEVDPRAIVVKRRSRQRGLEQYERMDAREEWIEVREGPARLWIDPHDHVDVGLFLDHRPLRLHLGRLARGRRFLNLFAYTGAATVHAALGGARATTTVDLSPKTLRWARANLERNLGRGAVGEVETVGRVPAGTGAAHRLLAGDARAYLRGTDERFDLVFVDPPTFSNSKRMPDTFDVQRDHVDLLVETARVLAPGGALFFSTNRAKFALDEPALRAAGLTVRDLGGTTIPPDFARPSGRRPMHRAFALGHADAPPEGELALPVTGRAR